MSGRHSEVLKNYCDKADLENFLLLEIDTTFDNQIDSWIAVAEKQVDNYLGYTTASGIMREVITDEIAQSQVGTDSSLMIFPRKIPIISVSEINLIKGTDEISLDLTSGDDTRYNIPTSADFILYPDYELSITGSSIISSFSALRGVKFFSKISYTGGYSEVPYDIRMATVNLLADIVMRHENKEGLESITQGRVSKRWYQRGSFGFNSEDRGQSEFYRDAIEYLKPYRLSARWL